MIKFTASGHDSTIIGLGLLPENLRRLWDGYPIRVRLSDMGFEGALGKVQIVIFAGESEAALRADLAPFINDETVVHEES